MARSGKPHVRVLYLAVLVVAICCLHGAHMVTAVGVTSGPARELLEWVEWAENVMKGADATKEVIDIALKKKKEDDKDKPNSVGAGLTTPVIHNDDFPKLPYVGVTGMKVGDGATLNMEAELSIDKSGHGGVLVITNKFPLTFLNKKAYDMLKAELSKKGQALAAPSKLVGANGRPAEQPCYADASAKQAITLVFAGGAEVEVEADTCWYEQSDGSVCLAVLPAPWSSGVTLIGTMLQQTKMVVVGDKWALSLASPSVGVRTYVGGRVRVLLIMCVCVFFCHPVL